MDDDGTRPATALAAAALVVALVVAGTSVDLRWAALVSVPLALGAVVASLACRYHLSVGGGATWWSEPRVLARLAVGGAVASLVVHPLAVLVALAGRL